jgi:acetyl-CoA C-acetyltransferase
MSAYYADMLLRSGKYDTALVVGYGKASNMSRTQFTNMMFEPFYTRPLGIDGVTSAALQARSYLDATGVDPRAAGEVVARNRANGERNPRVETGLDAMTPAEARDAGPVADPLLETDHSPVTDGACALVLATEEIAERADDSVAWIEGAAHASDGYTLDRDLSRAASCETAAEEAYDRAGVDDPAAAFDVAEVGASTSFQELLLYESLGLADRGEAPAVLDGDVAVNPSGGALAADPTMATGLVRIGEAALQVMDEAPGRGVEGASRALAHGTTGIDLQNNAVFVLEGAA